MVVGIFFIVGSIITYSTVSYSVLIFAFRKLVAKVSLGGSSLEAHRAIVEALASFDIPELCFLTSRFLEDGVFIAITKKNVP